MALIHQRHLVKLEREVDVFIARELAATLASGRGFDEYKSSDIETAISELGTNVLKYGKRGWASLRIDPAGFEAVVSDEGPGFGAAPQARSGLRVGLAGVKRLMDTFEIQPLTRGSRVLIRKDLPRSAVIQDQPGWAIDVVTRTRMGRSIGGDGHWVRDTEQTLTVAVIDGLGTGQGAANATSAVIESLESNDTDTPLDEMMSAAHHQARPTRGAVCLLARVDRGGSMTYTGVGDVSGYIDPPGEHLALSPGILGVDDPVMRTSGFPWTAQSRLTIWTDGIALPWDEVYRRDETMPPGNWTEAMALDHGMDRDDGLILLARETSPK